MDSKKVIIPEAVYTISEVVDLLGIYPRKLRRIAVKEGIEKIDNRYVFDGSFLIDRFKEDIEDNVSVSVRKVSDELQEEIEQNHQIISYLKVQVSERDATISKLKESNKKLERANADNTSEDELIKMIESLTDKKVFLFDEKDQNRLQEIFNSKKMLEKEMEYKDKEFSMLEESKSHYKKQMEYYMNSNLKLTKIMDRLSESLNNSISITQQRNFIEAKEKGFDS